MRDVVVLGGGPAGASAAAALARHGHAVTLLTRARPPAPWLAESIPASAGKLLHRLGLAPAVAEAGFEANGGNTVWWGGGPARAEPFPGAPGVHAERGRLEEALLGVARAAGADVRVGEPVRSIEGGPGGWRVARADGALDARWLLDATGRAGLLARRGARRAGEDAATLALVGRFETAEGFREDPSHTWIESYEDGWAWSVPVGPGLRCVTAMVDPRRTALRRDGLREMWSAEIGKTRQLRSRLEAAGARPAGPVRACRASPYTADRFGETGALLVGDAGSFIDPLSSYGVKKALASAWLASVATRTALVDPALADDAAAFFDRQEREVYRTYRARSLPFLEDAAAAHPHPFWETRVAEARAAAAGAGEHETPDAATRAAFEEIRERPRLELRPGRSLSRTRGLEIEGDRLVPVDHLQSGPLERSVRFLGGVDAVRLVELAPAHDDVPSLWEAYTRDGHDVSLPAMLGALAASLRWGLLEWEEPGGSGPGRTGRQLPRAGGRSGARGRGATP